jgi:tetratricopeptide (TPR) repeat protein
MIGSYPIVERLGGGGMGDVYKARHHRLSNKFVAIKTIKAGKATDVDVLLRFRREADTLAELAHPNIVSILDIGQRPNGDPYLVLEYVDGGSLERKIARKPQNAEWAAQAIETLARAIHAAHEKGIIHRDLKPANILMARDHTLKITDFGLAKRLDLSDELTQEGALLGTPYYMAPEQASGENSTLTAAADVWALGVILYELLTGRPPFMGEDYKQTLKLVVMASPVPPDRLLPKLSADLSAVCLKCLEKEPTRRYATAEALADDLRRWRNGEPTVVRPEGLWGRTVRILRRRPGLTALMLTSLLGVVSLPLLAQQEYAHWREQVLREEWEKKREQFQKELQKKHDHTLRALNDILELVTEDGPLYQKPGLDPLYQQLLTYYRELVGLEDGTDASGVTRYGADAHFNVGRIIAMIGDKQKALEAFAKAEEQYSTLANQSSEPELRHKLAKTRLERGKLQHDLGQMYDANKSFDAARDGLSHLSNADPSHLGYKQDLAEVWHNSGDLLSDLGERERKKAIRHFDNALDLRKELDKKSRTKKTQRDLARTYGYIGDVELDLRRYPEARTSYDASHTIRERLAKDANDLEAQFQLARSWANLGNHKTRKPDPDYQGAINDFEKSRELQAKLVERDPTVTDYKTDLGYTYNRIAELKLLLRRPPKDILASLDEALRIYEELRKDNDKAISVRKGLGENHLLRAELFIDWDEGHRNQVPSLLEAAAVLFADLCRDRKVSHDRYCLAKVQALRAELTRDKVAADALEGEAMNELNTAIGAGDLACARKRWQDVETERAFQVLRRHKRVAFEKVIKPLKE